MKLIKHNPHISYHQIPELFKEREIKTIRPRNLIFVTHRYNRFNLVKVEGRYQSQVILSRYGHKIHLSNLGRELSDSLSLSEKYEKILFHISPPLQSKPHIS